MDERQIVCRFLLPASEESACTVGPGVRALHDPTAGLGLASPTGRSRFAFLRACSRYRRRRAAVRTAWASYPLSAQRCGRLRGVGRGRFTGMLESVSITSFWSCTLAPPTATPNGTPAASTRTDRLTPSLPRSVGFGPVFFPAQRRLGHAPSRLCHCQSMPINSSYSSRARRHSFSNKPTLFHC